MSTLNLKILKGEYTIHRFGANTEIPGNIFQDDFFSISRTDDELSVVCSSDTELKSERSSAGWSCFKVMGPLDFSLTGILAKISAVLAAAKISIFAISTYDTDYILIKSENQSQAKQALIEAGYNFV